MRLLAGLRADHELCVACPPSGPLAVRPRRAPEFRGGRSRRSTQACAFTRFRRRWGSRSSARPGSALARVGGGLAPDSDPRQQSPRRHPGLDRPRPRGVGLRRARPRAPSVQPHWSRGARAPPAHAGAIVAVSDYTADKLTRAARARSQRASTTASITPASTPGESVRRRPARRARAPSGCPPARPGRADHPLEGAGHGDPARSRRCGARVWTSTWCSSARSPSAARRSLRQPCLSAGARAPHRRSRAA